MAIEEKVLTSTPANKAMEKPLNDSPAKIHIAKMVASVVPDVIIVRTNVDYIARLMIVPRLFSLLLFINSRILSPTIIESFSE